MTTSQLKRREDALFRVMRLIAANPEATRREMAIAAGISIGSAQNALNVLTRCGFVENSSGSQGRSGQRLGHALTPSGIREMTSMTADDLARRLVEYEALSSEIDRLRGGNGTGTCLPGQESKPAGQQRSMTHPRGLSRITPAPPLRKISTKTQSYRVPRPVECNQLEAIIAGLSKRPSSSASGPEPDAGRARPQAQPTGQAGDGAGTRRP